MSRPDLRPSLGETYYIVSINDGVIKTEWENKWFNDLDFKSHNIFLKRKDATEAYKKIKSILRT